MAEIVERGRRLHFGILGGAAARERHASALELFFDLVFVVAVAELADTFAHEPTVVGALRFAGLFVAVWWAWVGFTFYADRFDNDDDVVHRIILIVAMLAVASLAVAVPEAFDAGSGHAAVDGAAGDGVAGDGVAGHGVGSHGAGFGSGEVRFALSYVLVRVLLIVLYARAHAVAASARPLTGRYLTGFGIGASLWLLSVAVPAPWRPWLWAAGLLVELATPLASAAAISRVPFHVSHIPERFGLFVIIVLGEVVALDATAIAGLDLGIGPLAVAGAGFLVAAALWWLYFDCVDTSSMRRWHISGQTYVYLHLVVVGGITAFGVGVLLATRSSVEAGLRPTAHWALCGGIGSFLLAIGLIQLASHFPRGDRRAWLRMGVGAALVLLGWAGQWLPLLALETVLLAVLCGQIALEHRLRGAPDRDEAAGGVLLAHHPTTPA